jgi:hypothetical protein
MKKVLYAIIFLFTMTSVFSLSAQNKKAVGKWKYEVAQAPYGYNNGVLEIKQEKDKLTGQVNFSSGEDLKLQKLTMRNDTIWANVYVESENVEIVAKISNSKMKGSVNTSMGVMSLEADKVVDSKK